MKEFEIKVKAPEGKKPVYDEKSQTITFVPINIREQVKTFEDACKILDIPADKKICFSDSQLNAIMKLRIILKALNEGHEFSLTEGDVWYPWVRFYEECKLPASEKKNIVRSFTLNGKRYFLVGGGAYGAGSGLGDFYSDDGVGDADANVGFFACKDRETALYVSSQFGDLIFQAIYGNLINYYWY